MKSLRLEFLLIGLWLGACGGAIEPIQGTPPPSPTPAETAGLTGLSKTATPASTEPAAGSTIRIDPDQAGWGCFATANAGVSCLSPEGGWEWFTTASSPLGGNSVTALAACPDGSILMAHYGGIDRFDGAAWLAIEDGWGVSSVEAMACDGHGGIWVAHFGGASYFDGRTWTTHTADQFESGQDPSGLVNDLTIGRDGRVWLITPNTIASYRNGIWTVDEPGSGLDRRHFFDGLTVAPDGRVWAGHGSGLLASDDRGWKPFERTGFGIVRGVAAGPDGRVWLATFSQGLHVFDGSGWTAVGREQLSSGRTAGVVVDTAGRVWAATAWGVNVFDGTAWSAFHAHQSGLADNEIVALAIAGTGPVLPDPETRPPGSLTGRLVLDGGPAGGRPVEICVEPIYGGDFAGSPCAGQPFILAGRTDAGGRFAFDQVPAGAYAVVAEGAAGWAVLLNDFGVGSRRVLVAAGETVNLGRLAFDGEGLVED